jgi:hypothetical protein
MRVKAYLLERDIRPRNQIVLGLEAILDHMTLNIDGNQQTLLPKP